MTAALGGPADVTVVCVDVPGCEHGAILATADGGTVIFFSMATSFAAAALGAEGLAADVTMLIGNGYLPGHAELRAGPAARPSRACGGCSSGGSCTMTGTMSLGDRSTAERPRATRRPTRGPPPCSSTTAASPGSATATTDGARAAPPTDDGATSTARWSRRRSSTPTCTPPTPASAWPGWT